MAFKLADFVKETTTSTGTGSIALAGAATGYQAFSAKLSIGDTTTYSIRSVDVTGAPTGEWELVGGTYTGANTLSRDTVLASSNSDAAVSFSAGTKEVYITMPSMRAAWIRERLTADRTYYVRTDGSDSNTGLVNTSGGAFLTIQKAVDTVCNTLSLVGYTVTIQVADGTYTSATALRPLPDYGVVVIQGNVTTPANVLVSVTSGSCFTASFPGVGYTLKGMKLSTTTSGNCIFASNGGIVTIDTIDFGACAGVHIYPSQGGKIVVVGNYTISGGAAVHVQPTFSGTAFVVASKTVTITGTPAFSTAFAVSQFGADAYFSSITFSGSATGPRYLAQYGGRISVNGLTLPGSTAGSVATDGKYYA